MKAFDEYETNEDYQYDIPVGETFVYKGLNLRVVPDNYEYSCKDCFFDPGKVNYDCGRFCCFGSERLDEQNVIFEEVKE